MFKGLSSALKEITSPVYYMYVHPIPSDENEMLPQLSIRLLPVSRISDVEETGKEPFRSVV